ncbi:chemotaxis protein CheB, partial [Pseudomonadota bacterium]
MATKKHTPAKKRISKKKTPTKHKVTKKVTTAAEGKTTLTSSKIKKGNNFPVVGIGASAGGLEAFEKFLKQVPADTGMAFVLVQHLDPAHKSILTDLVKRVTPMQVFEVTNGMKVEPNCAYIIPPNRDMALLHGKLTLIEPAAPRGLRLPIDFFFRALAHDLGEQALCVVLSGTGSDGTLGLKAVKEAGGMVVTQDPKTAKYDGMPRSAIATGLVDYVLPPEEMVAQLQTYTKYAFDKEAKQVPSPSLKKSNELNKIYVLLRNQTGHDFSFYKPNTILRRIERRMNLNQISRLGDYVRYLQNNSLEIETLFKELLIGVSNFFRDPQAFEALKEKVIPALFKDKQADEPVRVWVTGCATGEEAYSITMLLREHMQSIGQEYKLQVFATDIDSNAIESARTGIYPNSIAADVPPR